MKEQKDTIREELEITILGLYESIKAECPHCVDEHQDKILNFIFNKLDQAYQSGAKDKVEEVKKDVADLRAEHANTARHGDDPDSAYDRVESLLWNYKQSLKDNT